MFETVGANIAKLDIRPESSLITILPGQSSVVQITLANLTNSPDNYALELEGLPEGWYALAESNFYLFPRWDATTTLTLDIPATALPQTYEVGLKLTAQNEPEISGQITIVVQVELAGNIPPATPHGLSNATTKLRAANEKNGWPTKSANNTAKIRSSDGEETQTPTWQKDLPPKILPASSSTTGRVFRKKTTRLDNDAQIAALGLTSANSESSNGAEPPTPLSYDGPAVGLKVETSDITIPAGRSFEQQVTLTNLSSLQNHFEITVTGLHPEWVHFSATFFNLYPERSEQFYLRIGIPSDVPAGRYRGRLQAQMVGTEALPTELGLVIDVKEALPALPDEPLSESGTLELTAENKKVALAPGEVYEQDISLINNTAFAETYTLSLERLPENWFSLSTQNFYLFPNWKEQTTLRLEIPAEAELGLYPARFTLTGQNESTPQSFLDIEIEIRPANPSLTQRRPTRKVSGGQTESDEGDKNAALVAASVAAPAAYWLLQGLETTETTEDTSTADPIVAAELTSAETEAEPAAFGEVETSKPGMSTLETETTDIAQEVTAEFRVETAEVRPLPTTKKLHSELTPEAINGIHENLRNRITAKFPAGEAILAATAEIVETAPAADPEVAEVPTSGLAEAATKTEAPEISPAEAVAVDEAAPTLKTPIVVDETAPTVETPVQPTPFEVEEKPETTPELAVKPEQNEGEAADLLSVLFPAAAKTETSIRNSNPAVQVSPNADPEVAAATQYYLAQLSASQPEQTEQPAPEQVAKLIDGNQPTGKLHPPTEAVAEPPVAPLNFADGDKPTVRTHPAAAADDAPTVVSIPVVTPAEPPQNELLSVLFPGATAQNSAAQSETTIEPVNPGDKPTVKMKTESVIVVEPPKIDGDKPTVRMKTPDPVEAAAVAKTPATTTKVVDGDKPTVRMKAVDPELLSQVAHVVAKTEIAETKFADGNRPTVKMRTADPELLALAADVTAKAATSETKNIDGNMPTVKVKPTGHSHAPTAVAAALGATAVVGAALAIDNINDTETKQYNKEETATATLDSEENPPIEEDVPTVKPQLLEQAVALVEAQDKEAAEAAEKTAENDEPTEDNELLSVLFPGKAVQAAKPAETEAPKPAEDDNAAKNDDDLVATLFPNAKQPEPAPDPAIDPDRMMAMLFNMPLAGTPPPPVASSIEDDAEVTQAATSEGELEIKMASTKLSILPGYNAQYMITVINNSKVTGVFEISQDGLPSRYCSFPNDNAYMQPGWSDTFTLSLNVPNGRPDGTYTGKLHVKCVEDETITGSLDISLRVGTPEPETENAISSGKRSTAKLAGVVPIGVVNRSLSDEEKKAITSGKRPTAKLGGVLNALQIKPPSSNLQQQAAAQNAGNTPQIQLFNNQPANATAGNVPNRAPVANQPDLAQPITKPPVKKDSLFGNLFGKDKDKKKQANQPGQIQTIPGQPPRPMAQGPQGAVQSPPRPGLNQPPGANANNPLAPNLGAAAALAPRSAAPKAPRKNTNPDVPHIDIELGRSHLTIVAGTKYPDLKIILANQTPLPDDFDLSIEDLPVTWFKFGDDANTVNMFPNQTGETAVTIQIPEKVRPALYVGKVVVRARTQPGILAEARLEVQVYSPLVVQGRLSPPRNKGYKAEYNLILRNSSMTQGRMRLSLAPSNPHCVGTFTPPEIVIAGGDSATVALKVGMAPKTASDYKQQEQTFQVQINPQWEVGDQLIEGGEVFIEGNYQYETPFVFIKNHPVLTMFLLILLGGFLLWQFVFLPGIQAGTVFQAAFTSKFPEVGKPVNNSLRIEQQAINAGVEKYNPFNSISVAEIKFEEEKESTIISHSVRLGKPLNAPIQYKGRVKIELKTFFLKFQLPGRIALNQQTSDIFFVADNPGDVNAYPWTIAPVDRMWEEFNKELRKWRLNRQNPQLFVNFVEVEGNTLFLRLERCQPNTEACGITGANREPGK